MGLFDFFKKKKPKSKPVPTPDPAADQDPNEVLLSQLSEGIELIGFKVKRHPEYVALIVNNELELAVAVLPGDHHLRNTPISQTASPFGLDCSNHSIGSRASNDAIKHDASGGDRRLEQQLSPPEALVRAPPSVRILSRVFLFLF